MQSRVREVNWFRQHRATTTWLCWVLGHILILGIVLFASAGITWLTLGFGGLLTPPFLIAAPFVAQWIGIRRELHPKREVLLWVGATALASGMYVSMALFPRVTGWELSTSISPRGLAIFGAMLGLAQWLVLRRHVSRAFRWVPANVLGIGAGALVGMITIQYVEPVCLSGIPASIGGSNGMLARFFCQLLGPSAALVAGIVVFIVITGTVLVWLFHASY